MTPRSSSIFEDEKQEEAIVSKSIKHVSQDELADMITEAVDLEARRIEQIGGKQVDAVAGGGVYKAPDIGVVMGYFPVNDEIL